MSRFEPGQVWQDEQGSWWIILSVWEDRHGNPSVKAQHACVVERVGVLGFGSIVYFDGNGVFRQPSGDIKLSVMVVGQE